MKEEDKQYLSQVGMYLADLFYNQNNMKQTGLKTCYSCHVDKLKAEMQDIGVWVCNECYEKSKAPVKKPVKSEQDEKR